MFIFWIHFALCLLSNLRLESLKLIEQFELMEGEQNQVLYIYIYIHDEIQKYNYV
jgi:hypothetical protein